MLEVIRTAGRIALTFIPVLLVRNHASRKLLKKIEIVKRESGDGALPRPVKEFVSKQGKLLRNIRRRTILFHTLVFTPFVLFWAAVVASLERTPLTGRYIKNPLFFRPPPKLLMNVRQVANDFALS